MKEARSAGRKEWRGDWSKFSKGVKEYSRRFKEKMSQCGRWRGFRASG